MKKIILIIFVLIAAVFLFSGNRFAEEKNSTEINASASFYPLYYFASEIGKNKSTVYNITPSGIEPHDYDPTPKDIARIQNSSFLIVNGAGFEPWLEKIKLDLQNVKIITATDGITLQKNTEEEHEEGESEEEHAIESVSDPHIWLSPVLAKSQVDKILKAYIDTDPTNKNLYEKNGDGLKKRLDALDDKFKKGLSSCKRSTFVTSHSAFGYLAKEYNLIQKPISGLSPDQEPSSSEMAEISEFAKTEDVKYIFFETLVSPKLSETIATEVGAKTLVLDPIEGLSDDDIKQGKNYFSVMEDNLKNLQIALECSK